MTRTRVHQQDFADYGNEETQEGCPAAPLGFGRLAALQGPLGNAAIASMLQGGDGLAADAAPRGEPRARERFPFQFEMERLFGERFSDIEVELGASDRLEAMQADGAVAGGEVLFGTSNPSRELVAHELAHVVQQRRHGPTGANAEARVSDPHDGAEQEADRLAGQAARGQAVRPSARPTPGAVHRSAANGKPDFSGTKEQFLGPTPTMVQWEGANGEDGDAFLQDAASIGCGVRVMVRWTDGDEGNVRDLVVRAKEKDLRTYVTLTMGASDWTGTSPVTEFQGRAGPGYLPSDPAGQRDVINQFVAWCETVLKGFVDAGVFPDDVSVMNEPNVGNNELGELNSEGKQKGLGWFNIDGMSGKKQRKRLARLYASMTRRVARLVKTYRKEYNDQHADDPLSDVNTGVTIGDLALGSSAVGFLKDLIRSAKRSNKPITADAFAVHPYLPRSSESSGEAGVTRGLRYLYRLDELLEENRRWLHTKDDKRLRLSFTEYARTQNGSKDDEGANLLVHLLWEQQLKEFADSHGVKDFVCYSLGRGDVSPSDQDMSHSEDPTRKIGWVNPIGDSLPSTESATRRATGDAASAPA